MKPTNISMINTACESMKANGLNFSLSCGSSYCLHYVTGTHCVCLVYGLFVSIMSRVLIESVLPIIFLSPYYGYLLGVLCQSSICHHDVRSTHWHRLVSLSNCLHDIHVLIGSLLSIVHLSIMPQVLIGVSCPLLFVSVM